VDVDRYVVQHQADWARLAELNRRATRPGRLAPGELDELVALYQRVSTHLSYVRTYVHDASLVTHLTMLVADAHGVIYRRRGRAGRGIARFFADTFPAAVWVHRWFVVAAAVLTFAPALALGVWIANSDRAFEATAPDAVREAYINEDFESYYSSEPAVQFASEVFTTNVRVAMLAFAAGVLVCVVTAWILVMNGANLGVAAGLFAAVGQQPKFWGLILPHGFLELSCVVVAGAAGLLLGWTVIDPGDRPRLTALAQEGRRSAAVVLGLILALGVAALIEGFITGRGVPTGVRVGIGLLAGALFWAYVLIQGRIATSRGVTGALGEAESRGRAPDVAPSPA
jgi:uncharacterized membrane protein SpoIIM required for sporulation